MNIDIMLVTSDEFQVLWGVKALFGDEIIDVVN